MRKKVWRGQTYRQNSQPASPKFWRMKKNQSFKIPLNVSRENIEIISDFKTSTIQNPPLPRKVNSTSGELELNKNIGLQESEVFRRTRNGQKMQVSSYPVQKLFLAEQRKLPYVNNMICRLDWKIYGVVFFNRSSQFSLPK